MLGLKHIHAEVKEEKIRKLGGRKKKMQTEDCDMKLASVK